MITINNSLTIPHDEVELTFSRSQGPGGQNVNKVNSKVTLHWDVENSRSISVRLKQRIYSKHSGKINNDGKLVVGHLSRGLVWNQSRLAAIAWQNFAERQ